MRIALTVRHPWAWLIAEGIKDFENRTWFSASVNGPVYIHAGKEPSPDFDIVRIEVQRKHGIRVPDLHDLQFGGFIAKAMFKPVVMKSDSPWFEGPYGYPIFSVEKISFVPFRGAQGFWQIPDNIKLTA